MVDRKRTNTNPLYHTIKEDIKKQIHEEIYRPGDFISTEGELCRQYDVSRVTVRRAIEELIDEGVLNRESGKTAHVAEKSIPRSLNQLGGLHEELSRDGIKCSSFILNSEKIRADSIMADNLKINEGDCLHRVERLRYANGTPLSYQILYLVDKSCPDLDVQKLATKSLFETLEKEYNLKIEYATQTISAALATYKQAALLELPERTCMLCIKRITYLKDGNAIEYSESFYVASKYNLSMTLQRN